MLQLRYATARRGARVALSAAAVTTSLFVSAVDAHADFAVYPYTHGSGCSGRIDPITFVYYGQTAHQNNSLNHTATHMGWRNSDGSNQTFSSHGNCRTQHWQRADSCGICNRYHTRAGQTWHQDLLGRYETVLTPHHEEISVAHLCHAVDGNGSRGSGFDKARSAMIRGHLYTHHYWGDYAYWGNTATRRQCDGDRAGSNGYVAWFAINGGYH